MTILKALIKVREDAATEKGEKGKRSIQRTRETSDIVNIVTKSKLRRRAVDEVQGTS